jgi:hypothetical protein
MYRLYRAPLIAGLLVLIVLGGFSLTCPSVDSVRPPKGEASTIADFPAHGLAFSKVEHVTLSGGREFYICRGDRACMFGSPDAAYVFDDKGKLFSWSAQASDDPVRYPFSVVDGGVEFKETSLESMLAATESRRHAIERMLPTTAR